MSAQEVLLSLMLAGFCRFLSAVSRPTSGPNGFCHIRCLPSYLDSVERRLGGEAHEVQCYCPLPRAVIRKPDIRQLPHGTDAATPTSGPSLP